MVASLFGFFLLLFFLTTEFIFKSFVVIKSLVRIFVGNGFNIWYYARKHFVDVLVYFMGLFTRISYSTVLSVVKFGKRAYG